MKLIQNRYIINFEGYRYEGQIAVGAGNPHLVNTLSQNSKTIIHESRVPKNFKEPRLHNFRGARGPWLRMVPIMLFGGVAY
jgi:hypothetical protein